MLCVFRYAMVGLLCLVMKSAAATIKAAIMIAMILIVRRVCSMLKSCSENRNGAVATFSGTEPEKYLECS